MMQRFNLPALLSFACGFVSLSLEILWVRLFSFARMSTPAAFGFVLMAYLIGIAFGAHWGSKACRQAGEAEGRGEEGLWQHSIAALLLSAVLTLGLPALFAALQGGPGQNPLVDLLLMACTSSVLAYVFPIAHHLGAGPKSGRQGQRFAWVYTSNVLGAALGPLVTGYVLLDFFTLQQALVVLCVLQLLAAGGFALAHPQIGGRMLFVLVSCTLTLGITLTARGMDEHGLIQKVNHNGQRAATVVENRHGVITIFSGAGGDDVVFGGNVYDGRTNLNPERNTNGLHRPLLLAALQPEPRRVLMVGLSIGTWLALVREFPGVESVDVVEINAGYVQAAQAYQPQARALADPRVHVVVDDARRWLRLHSNKQYDLIIMNTTWHWRANVSLLLSREFLQLARSHMAPGAVMSFNATGSDDAFRTAAEVFPHAYRYDNFVYAADFDFRTRKNTSQAHAVFSELKIDGAPFFASESPLIEHFLKKPFITLSTAQTGFDRPLEVITDWNMITEFKYGLAWRH